VPHATAAAGRDSGAVARPCAGAGPSDSRMSSLVPLASRLAGRRVGVIGDVMLDHFLFGHVHRISPEAPVPVVRFTRDEYRLGGAANVARNVASLGGRVTLV